MEVVCLQHRSSTVIICLGTLETCMLIRCLSCDQCTKGRRDWEPLACSRRHAVGLSQSYDFSHPGSASSFSIDSVFPPTANTHDIWGKPDIPVGKRCYFYEAKIRGSRVDPKHRIPSFAPLSAAPARSHVMNSSERTEQLSLFGETDCTS